MKDFLISFAIVLLVSCGQDKNQEQKIENAIPNTPSDTLSTNDERTDEQTVASSVTNDRSVNMDFEFGNSSFFRDCNFLFECDCCFSFLSIQDSIFYVLSPCMSSNRLTKGRVEYLDKMIKLKSNVYHADRTYNFEYEMDTTVNAYSETISTQKPYQITFEIDSCNGQILLENTTKKSFALESSKSFGQILSKYGAENLVQFLDSADNLEFEINATDLSKHLEPGCACAYALDWDSFERNQFIYVNDYGTRELLFINNELVELDITTPQINAFKVDEIVYEEKQTEEVFRKSGVLKITSKNGFYLEVDFVGECGC